MNSVSIYSLKIKIISLHFKIRAIDNPIIIKMYLGTHLNTQSSSCLMSRMFSFIMDCSPNLSHSLDRSQKRSLIA